MVVKGDILMKRLFVYCQYNLCKKLYLKSNAKTRRDLFNKLGTTEILIGGILYHISDVVAENNTDLTSVGMIVGGLIGFCGGVWGVILGGIFGGMYGWREDNEENERVCIFNESTCNYIKD